MNIHFCVDMDGWVLQRVVERIVSYLPGSTYGQNIRTNADANVYFPYYNLRVKGPSLDLPVFTHYERDDSPGSERKREAWHHAAGLADQCLAMSKGALELLPAGTRIVELEADPQFLKTPTFGVVGREYVSGRKKYEWATGLPGNWIYSGGELPWEAMPAFYAQCDYIVVLSNLEGGPMCVKEAIAAGKPVIAPNVGWAWDYPVIRYEGRDGLRKTILALVAKDETQRTAREIASAVHYLKDTKKAA